MKTLKLFIFSGALALILVAPLAVGKDKPDGRQLYKDLCKPCHASGSDYGE